MLGPFASTMNNRDKIKIANAAPYQPADIIWGEIKPLDAECKFEFKIVKTRAVAKPKKPAKEHDPNVEMKEGFYGDKYPAKPDENWQVFSGIEKKVHLEEADRFLSEYAMCCEKGIYVERHLLGCTEVGGFVSLEFTKGPNAKWGQCAHYEYYCRLDQLIQAYKISEDDDGDKVEVPIKVSRGALRNSYAKCQFTDKYFQINYLVEITGSDKYKMVNCLAINDVDFAVCPQCNRYFEERMLRPGAGGHKKCARCAARDKAENVILKHDAKNYPPIIWSVEKRLGSVIRGGWLFSTKQHEEIKVQRNYGVEVETELDLNACLKEGVDRFDIAKSILNTMGQDFIIIKEDGTLITNGKYSDAASKYGTTHAGFEIVTAPASLQTHRERWLNFKKDKYHHILRAWDEPYCKACGFHIHVSREAILSDLMGGRMLAFLNAKFNRKFIWKIAGRSEDKFNKYMDHKASDFIHPGRVINPEADGEHNQGRRTALNLKNRSTVEIRIFRGTIDPRHIIRNLEFYDSMIDFCMPYTRSLNDLQDFRKYVKFVDVNRKRWPLLAAWFGFHEIIKLKKILRPEKVNHAKLTLDLENIPEKEILIPALNKA